jgi:hypothetical protein
LFCLTQNAISNSVDKHSAEKRAWQEEKVLQGSEGNVQTEWSLD